LLVGVCWLYAEGEVFTISGLSDMGSFGTAEVQDAAGTLVHTVVAHATPGVGGDSIPKAHILNYKPQTLHPRP
jgi:hypothetical protein